MDDNEEELGEGGQVPLLVGGGPWVKVVMPSMHRGLLLVTNNGSPRWRPGNVRGVSGQQLLIKGIVVGLSGGDMVAEEREGDPLIGAGLRKNSAHTCITCFGQDAEWRVWGRVCKQGGIGEEVFGQLESCRHGVILGQGGRKAGSQKAVKGLEEGGSLGKKAGIQIYQAKEMPQLMGGGWVWKLADNIRMGGEGANSGLVNVVAKRVQLMLAEWSLFQG